MKVFFQKNSEKMGHLYNGVKNYDVLYSKLQVFTQIFFLTSSLESLIINRSKHVQFHAQTFLPRVYILRTKRAVASLVRLNGWANQSKG